MDCFKVKTKGNANPKGKPRVYFTCHPDDFEKAFEKVCGDIFKTHDCAIYYTENAADEYADENWETDLSQMNLFVIPVTFRLLCTPNRTMNVDFSFAKANHIPVLPIMLEPGIDEIYSKEENFGELQYLNPYDFDLTAISYKEKLRKYLDSVLISDELAERIRAAFDAYIFLSYRKKDRKYANELMQIIHSNPLCQNIAIWYDEFLTPGESFKENINKILENSRLFALLVTPSLLEEPDGKPNFVMDNEYPEAKKSGIEILPAEMVETNSDLLKEKYDKIPESYRFDSEEDKNRFIEIISRLAHERSENNPEHDYLLGLAYLDGIDVEVNKKNGVELIERAAEDGLIEAIVRLCDMYSEGIGVNQNLLNALKWSVVAFETCKERYGIRHPETLTAQGNLSLAYAALGENLEAFKIAEENYNLTKSVLGEKHPDTLTALGNLASLYLNDESYDAEKSIELCEKVFNNSILVLGKDHPDTVFALRNLASAYEGQDDEKALILDKKAYEILQKTAGNESIETITTINHIGIDHINLARSWCVDDESEIETHYIEATYWCSFAYLLLLKLFGEKHPETSNAQNNYIFALSRIDNGKDRIKVTENIYRQSCSILGEEHCVSLNTLSYIGSLYSDFNDDFETRLRIENKIYNKKCELYGKDNISTQNTLNNMAYCYCVLENYYEGLALYKEAYHCICKKYSNKNKFSVNVLLNMAKAYVFVNNESKTRLIADYVLTMLNELPEYLVVKLFRIYKLLNDNKKCETVMLSAPKEEHYRLFGKTYYKKISDNTFNGIL